MRVTLTQAAKLFLLLKLVLIQNLIETIPVYKQQKKQARFPNSRKKYKTLFSKVHDVCNKFRLQLNIQSCGSIVARY